MKINSLPPKQSSLILSDQPSPTPFNVEDLNITAITAVYLENMMSSKNANNIVLELQLAIEKISPQYQSQPQSKLIQTQSKSKSLTKALTEIKNHNSSLESKKLVESDIKSYKDNILKTLAVYKNYFSIKFSEDGNPINCDSDIKKILANFDKKGPLFTSINSSSDSKGIKDLRYELNVYLAILTLLAESTINNNPNDPIYSPDQKKQYVDAIKTSLLVFPGDATDTLQDHNCVQGTRQRVDNAIFALKKLSQETTCAKDYIDKISTQLAKKVTAGNQIHIPASLLGSLMMDRTRIAQIDNFYTSPQSDITLNQIIEFSHSFNKEIIKNLLDSRTAIIEDYIKLSKGKIIGNETVANFDDINEFVEAAKSCGFNFNATDLYDENYEVMSEEIPISKLISAKQLQEKYFQIPTDKFKEELSKIKDLTLPIIDYLKHLPAPKDLFKIHNSGSPESTESPPIETLTNRLDVNKIGNLVSLFTETSTDVTTESQDALTKKSKITAGLITLRNILDCYETSDNTYLYFLKFDKKFKEKTGNSFLDFFYEMNEEGLKVKAEFSEEKSILETIKTRKESQERLLYGNLTPTSQSQLRDFINNLLSIENFESEESKSKFKELLTENNLELKNNSEENLLNILYQFDVEALKTALESKPELIKTITQKDKEGLSLIQKLAKKDLTKKDNEELLLYILEKFKTYSQIERSENVIKDIIEMINQDALLLDIVQHNNSNILIKIIEITASEINLDQVKIDGLTLLHFAAQNGHLEIVKFLIEKGADVDPGGVYRTPLHFAAQNGHLEIVKFLIEKGADVNSSSYDGSTPLHFAAQNGHLEIVKFLIEKRADVNASNKNYSTPLYLAAQNGHLQIVKTLFENGANVNPRVSWTPLHSAAQNGHLEMVKFLIEKGANVNAFCDGSTPLHFAAQNGHLEIVKFLIEKGADVNASIKDFFNPRKNSSTPLHFAAENGHLEIVKFLIEKGADVNASNKNYSTPLYLAAQNGHLEVVNALLKKGADIENRDQNDSTPLYIAAENGHLEVVTALIDEGANVNACSKDGFTPLHIGAHNGHLEVVKTLFENGANFGIRFQVRYPLSSQLYSDVAIRDFIKTKSKPDEIKNRDCNLQRKKIAKLQKSYIEGLKDTTLTSLETSPAINLGASFDEISPSTPPSQHNSDLKQDQEAYQNELLKTFRFLKFAVSYFVTSKDSALTNQQVISEMLKNAIEHDQIGLTTCSIVQNLIDENPTQEDLRKAINKLDFLRKTDEQLIDYSANLAKKLIETNNSRTIDDSREVTNEGSNSLLRNSARIHHQIENFSTMLKTTSEPQIKLLTLDAKKAIEQKLSSLNDSPLKKAIFDAHSDLMSLTIKYKQQIQQNPSHPSSITRIEARNLRNTDTELSQQNQVGKESCCIIS